MKTETRTLDVMISEGDERTTADVSMSAGSGQVLHGHGTARRHPDDPNVPRIGDEIAIARALSQLAHELLDTAAHEIGERQHTRVHLPA